MQADHIITPMAELLDRRADVDKNKTAFTDPSQSVTYAQLRSRVRAVAGYLKSAGFSSNDKLLMFLDNCVEVAEGYLAAPVGGFVTACVNPAATERELAHMLTDSAPRAVLTDEAHLPVVLQQLSATPSIKLIIVAGAEDIGETVIGASAEIVTYAAVLSQVPDSEPTPAAIDDWSWLLYTSGTTGRPKGVMLTQRGCLWVTASCWVPWAGLSSQDHLLSALPLFHSYALVLCVISIPAVGATIDLVPKFSRKEVERRLAEEPVTFVPGVPTMFHYLMQGSETRKLDAPSLRVCVSAGALLQGNLNTEFEKFAGVNLLDGYGITETSTMVTMNGDHGRRIPGSCGFPLPGLSVRLVDPATLEDVAPGDIGELWVQGPNVMLGYHNRPDANAQVLVNGWYRTGDLARRDPDGFLFITGRIKELIIRGGENIYPAEIETVLLESAEVLDAAVVGKAHPQLGEVPVAYIVPQNPDTFDPEAVKQYCSECVAHFKVPAEIKVITEIPRTGSGKIRRFELGPETASAISAPAVERS